MGETSIEDKNVVFFSHTSKDRDLVLAIKDIIDQATENQLSIFMSSDGQSIPFGTNWVHKVEEGLSSTSLMFVMITEQSVQSGWVYFEAGFAYSKKIKVVPIGLGFDVSMLKSPLNLLQGFNVTSCDGLNNIISVINKEYKTNYTESITQDDYLQVMKLADRGLIDVTRLPHIIKYAEFSIPAKYKSKDGNIIINNLDEYINRIIKYLEEQSIPYSIKVDGVNKTVLVDGISIQYTDRKQTSSLISYDNSEVSFSISPYNLFESLDIAIQLLHVLDHIDYYVRILFKNNVKCVTEDQDVSSLLSKHNSEFNPIQEQLGRYQYRGTGLSFSSKMEYYGITDRKSFPVITIAFHGMDSPVNDIIDLILRLYEIGIISLE